MRVLVADDQPLARSMLQIALEKWGYDVIECADGIEALRILDQEDAPQVAILDWMMPGMSGPEICSDIRSRTSERYTYILLVTSKNEKDDIIEGMTSGADDYIVKPFDLNELQARLRAGSRIIALENDLIQAREELRTQATHDSLTGLLNRGEILDVLNRECARASRERQPLSIIMGDLDHFKEINDNYGHPIGDVVLRETAERLRASVRSFDAVGRYGGEEFLIIAINCEGAQAKEVAEHIRQAVAGEPIVTPAAAHQVTISLGLTSRTVGEERSAQELLRASDQAMYHAKRAGRNRVEVHPGGM